LSAPTYFLSSWLLEHTTAPLIQMGNQADRRFANRSVMRVGAAGSALLVLTSLNDERSQSTVTRSERSFACGIPTSIDRASDALLEELATSTSEAGRALGQRILNHWIGLVDRQIAEGQAGHLGDYESLADRI
jgi:hypothetical protein